VYYLEIVTETNPRKIMAIRKDRGTATPTNEIKKALRIAFPETKFTCKTHYSTTKVHWVMDLGCPVTVKAVNEIAQQFSTYEVISDPYADYINSKGLQVSCSPEYTPERRQWAIDCVVYQYENSNDYKAVFDGYNFQTENGEYHHYADKAFAQYLQEGCTSILKDEHGQEPSEKIWYYERLNKTPEVVEATEVIETVEEIKDEVLSHPTTGENFDPLDFPLKPSQHTEPEKTNVIKFPVIPSKNDDFYVQVYESWVKKMVIQGQYNKIKSFEEWYVIAIEILP